MTLIPLANWSQLGAAIIAGVGPKSVGGGYRMWDDRNAPKEIRNATIKRESATLLQVAGYSALIKQGANWLKRALVAYAEAHPANRNAHSLKKMILSKNSTYAALSLVAVSAAANFMAEFLSRRLAPRDIWDKGNIKRPVQSEAKKSDDQDDDDDDDPKKADNQQTPAFMGNASLAAAYSFANAGHSASSAVNPFSWPAFTQPIARAAQVV